MGLGGENVGRAYVQLIANGDSLPDDVSDALDRLEPTLRDAGAKHAEAYDKAFDKQYEKDDEKFRAKALKNLEKGLGKMAGIGRVIGEDTGDNLFDGIERTLAERLNDGDLAKLIRKNLQEDFAHTGSFDRLAASLKDINGEAIKATKEIDRLNNELADGKSKQASKDMEELEREIRKTIHETDRLTEETDRITGSQKKWIVQIRGMRHLFPELNKEVDKGNDVVFKWLQQVKESGDRTHQWGQKLHTLNVQLDHSATLTGKAFGKGSRNDFLNFTGTAVEGLTRIFFLAPKVAESIGGIFGGGGGGGGGAAKLGQLAAGLASSIIGVAIALGAVTLVAGPVAALLSGLAAAFVAVTGAAAFAAGAIGAVALVLAGPLAVGLGVVVAALIGMDDQTRKSVNGPINQLVKKFKDAGDSAGEAFGPRLAEAVKKISPQLDGLNGFFRRVGAAIGDVTVNLADMTQSRGFHNFTQAFGDFIPNALRDLGTIVGNTLGGIGGILEAAIPITERFLGWMIKITDRFSDWANSKSGQEQLLGFFDRAADSAESLGGLIADAAKAIAELFDQGKGSGDTIIDELADKFEQFTEWLQDPKNKDSINEFFANGVQVAEDLGNLVLDLGQLIDDFDTSETRQELHDIFDILGDILDVIGLLGTNTAASFRQIQIITGWVRDFAGAVAWGAEETGKLVASFVTGPLTRYGDALISVARGVVKIVTGPDKALTALQKKIEKIDFSAIYEGARNWINKTSKPISNFGDKLNSSVKNAASRAKGYLSDLASNGSAAFNRLAGRAQAKFSDIRSDASAMIGKIKGFFGDLPGDIAGKLATLGTKVKGKFDDIITDVKGIPGKIVDLFSGLAGEILSAIGTIDIGSLIKIPAKGGGVPFVPGVATGGTFGHVTGGPQLRWVGEDGPEAIVPLRRRLDQVDPSVRALSAIAQGLGGGGGMTIQAGAIQVNEVANGRATAQALLNALVAKAG